MSHVHVATQYAVHPQDVLSYDTPRLRKEFLSESLMRPQEIRLVYTHYDRFVYGGIMPVNAALTLPTLDTLKSAYFLERREMGILNIGGAGTIEVDGHNFQMKRYDCLYIGKGAQRLNFASIDSGSPALFYLTSTPAHHTYPTTHAGQEEANQVSLGDAESANQRILYQYIHEQGIPSCQLVMGFTEMLPGNVWNTFPPHTHERRMEVYFYFDLPPDQLILHLMGNPHNTRHIAVRNHDAVVSPPWSIHSGVGTQAYKFIWGMGGENKAFADMDAVPLSEVF